MLNLRERCIYVGISYWVCLDVFIGICNSHTTNLIRLKFSLLPVPYDKVILTEYFSSLQRTGTCTNYLLGAVSDDQVSFSFLLSGFFFLHPSNVAD